MATKEKLASVGRADQFGTVLPAGCGAPFHTKNPSLTQAKAALQAGLIQPDFAALVALVWAEVHLGLEVLQ
jgi:hypothetical protein